MFIFVEDLQFAEFLVLFQNILFAYIFVEYDTEIDPLEFEYGRILFQRESLEIFSYFFDDIISYVSPENTIDLQHVIDVEDSDRTVFFHGTIVQTFFIIRESGKMVDMLIERFIGFGDILSHDLKISQFSTSIAFRYDKGPKPDQRSVFLFIADIARPHLS